MVEKYFKAYALVGQDILGSPESWDKVLALVPDDILHTLGLLGVEGGSARGKRDRWGPQSALTVATAPGAAAERVPQEAGLGAALGAAEGPHGVDTGEWAPRVGLGAPTGPP